MIGASSEKDPSCWDAQNRDRTVIYAGFGLAGVPKVAAAMLWKPIDSERWQHAVTNASAATS